MRLAARLGTLACALALTACGGASHTPDGGSTDGVDAGSAMDGAAPDDAGAEQDSGATPDAGAAEDGGEERDSGAPHDAGGSEETCASIEARYAQVVEEKASCEQPTDCRITSGHCGVGLGGCWYAVSGDVSELDALAERYRDLGCTSAVCRCLPPPESASCEAGRCVAD